MSNIKLTPVGRHALCDDLRLGIAIPDLAEKYQVSKSLIYQIRKAEGIEQPPVCKSRYIPPRSWEVMQLWEQCEKNYQAVADRLCVSRGELERLVEYYKLPIAPEGPRGRKEGSGKLFGYDTGEHKYPWIHRSVHPALAAILGTVGKTRIEIHRAIFTLALGRRLPYKINGQIVEVHHLNGDDADFRPENMCILTRKEHSHVDARHIFRKADKLREAGKFELALIAEREAICQRDGWRADPQSQRVMEARHLAALGRDEHYLPRLNQAYEQINALWQEWIRSNDCK